MDATPIHLDGNYLGDFISQTFIGRRKVISLFLNSSNMFSIGKNAFNGLGKLEILHLEHNWISEIDGEEFQNLTSIKELYLHNNQIFYIDQTTFSNLSSLQVNICSFYFNVLKLL